MDIRCPACATLYELDEAQIAPGGTNIRCSACGQIFRVRSADLITSSCMVRRSSTGEVTHFDDLRTLQRWIADGKIQPDDLISRSGKTWRHLYEIGEIAAWFAHTEEDTGRVARTGDTYPPRPSRDAGATQHLASPGVTSTPLPHAAQLRVGAATLASPGLTPRPTAVTPASLTPSVPRERVEAPIRMRPANLTPEKPALRPSEWSLGDAPIEHAEPGFARLDPADTGPVVPPVASRARTVVGAVALVLLGGVLGVVLARGGFRAHPSDLADAPHSTDVAASLATSDGSDATAPALAADDATNVDDIGGGAVFGSDGAPGDGSGSPANVAAMPHEPAPSAPGPPIAPEPQEAERMRPAGYEALMSDANGALDAGDASRALELFERAADQSDRAEAHTGVARSYQALGRQDLAAARYRRALSRNDRYAPAWVGLGDVLRAEGDAAGAIEAYEQVVRIVPSGTLRARAERALEALR